MWRLVLLMVILVLLEIAIVVPVVVTQRQADAATGQNNLATLSATFLRRLNFYTNQFVYNVVRTSGAAALVRGFLSESQLQGSLVLSQNPTSSPAQLFVWVPLVPLTEKAQYDAFYGFPITQISASGRSVVNATARSIYAPLTLLVPSSPNSTKSLGFDLLSTSITSDLFINGSSLYLVPHATLLSPSPTSFGLLVISLTPSGSGYVIGRIGMDDLLSFSSPVPLASVTLAAFDASVAPSKQLLYVDNSSPVLINVTTFAQFEAIAPRSGFFVSNFTVLGHTIVVGALYDPSLVASNQGTTWITLLAILLPVCCCIDAVCFIVTWQWLIRQERAERDQEQRQSTQLLLGYVNHEIRNPLQAIVGLSELCMETLDEPSGNERTRSDLATIARSAEFIEHIAKDILDVRRIQEGQVALELASLNLATLASDLEKATRPLLRLKPDVVFHVDVSPDVSSIPTDRYRVSQILMNFLSNAIKHTEHGSITLGISYLPESMRVRFSVADTGRGIPDDKKQSLFAQFQQVESRDASQHGGFGLGLFLSKMLAELLGGTVGFESTLGEGSVFWLELPLDQANLPLEAQFARSKLDLY
jgi:signal transduction histidine kinase